MTMGVCLDVLRSSFNLITHPYVFMAHATNEHPMQGLQITGEKIVQHDFHRRPTQRHRLQHIQTIYTILYIWIYRWMGGVTYKDIEFPQCAEWCRNTRFGHEIACFMRAKTNIYTYRYVLCCFCGKRKRCARVRCATLVVLSLQLCTSSSCWCVGFQFGVGVLFACVTTLRFSIRYVLNNNNQYGTRQHTYTYVVLRKQPCKRANLSVSMYGKYGH